MAHRRRRTHRIGDAVDQFVADVLRPGKIIAIGVSADLNLRLFAADPVDSLLPLNLQIFM